MTTVTEIFTDIETIQNVLVAWEEGASDEKRMARESLRQMLATKQAHVEQYEHELDVHFASFEE